MMSMAGTAPAPPPGVAPSQAPITASAVHRRMKPEDSANHITVSDPVQHQEGIQKYTSYRVDVRPPTTNPAQPQGTQDILLNHATFSAVLRRYSDFLWLYERLHVERAGAIVPPIPEKQPVGRFSAAFVEDRRSKLEVFLRRVVVHPELADATCVDTFLRADDMTFAAAKQIKGKAATAVNMSASMGPQHHPYGGGMPPSAAMPRPPQKDGFKRWFAEAKTSIAGDLVKSPDDDLFEEIQRYVHGLDTQMKNVSHQSSNLVRKGKEIANGLFEFGLAFSLLGQSEADALGDALGKLGATADQLSVLSGEHANREVAHLEEPLQDYIKLIHAVKLALQRRHEKRLSYSTCLASVESKQSQLAKLRASGPGNEAKAYAMEMSLRKSQDNAEMAREDFAVVSQRVLREVDRFKREKAEEMRLTVLDYIQLQVEYNQKMEQVWSALIPQLERVQLDSNSVASQTPVARTGGGAPAVPPMPVGPPPPAPTFLGNPQTAVPQASLTDPSMISVQYRDLPMPQQQQGPL